MAHDYTFANVRVCADAVAKYLKHHGLAERGVVIGFDSRFASPEFATEIANVTSANGVHTNLSDRNVPTPEELTLIHN